MPDRHVQTKATASSSTPRTTPTAIPAFALVLSPEEDEEEDVDAAEEALDVGDEVDVFVMVLLELEAVVIALVIAVEDDVLRVVAVPVIVLDILAAERSTCGAGAANVSFVGFPQSGPVPFHPQHAQRPVSGL